MNRLLDLLERALRLHECVALPSMGAFLKEYVYARYDSTENTIYPASEKIYFNADLLHRDGVLDELYAQTFGISVRRARLMLDEDIASLRKELYRNGQISLGKVGRLEVIEDGRLLFSPTESEKGTSAAYSYGLLPVAASARWLPASLSAEDPSRKASSPQSPNYFYFRISKRATQWAAVVAIGALSLVPVSWVSTSDHYTAGVRPFEWVKKSDLVQKPLVQEVQKVANQEPTTTIEVLEETAPVALEEATPSLEVAYTDLAKGGYIVVATFTSTQRASAYINSLADKADQKKLRIVRKGKNQMVIYSHYEAVGEAYTALPHVTLDGKPIEGGWVLEVK